MEHFEKGIDQIRGKRFRKNDSSVTEKTTEDVENKDFEKVKSDKSTTI